MGPEGTGLYGWTPARHTPRLDSECAHQRASDLRLRRLAEAEAPQSLGLMSRFGEWLSRVAPPDL